MEDFSANVEAPPASSFHSIRDISELAFMKVEDQSFKVDKSEKIGNVNTPGTMEAELPVTYSCDSDVEFQLAFKKTQGLKNSNTDKSEKGANLNTTSDQTMGENNCKGDCLSNITPFLSKDFRKIINAQKRNKSFTLRNATALKRDIHATIRDLVEYLKERERELFLEVDQWTSDTMSEMDFHAAALNCYARSVGTLVNLPKPVHCHCFDNVKNDSAAGWDLENRQMTFKANGLKELKNKLIDFGQLEIQGTPYTRDPVKVSAEATANKKRKNTNTSARKNVASCECADGWSSDSSDSFEVLQRPRPKLFVASSSERTMKMRSHILKGCSSSSTCSDSFGEEEIVDAGRNEFSTNPFRGTHKGSSSFYSGTEGREKPKPKNTGPTVVYQSVPINTVFEEDIMEDLEKLMIQCDDVVINPDGAANCSGAQKAVSSDLTPEPNFPGPDVTWKFPTRVLDVSPQLQDSALRDDQLNPPRMVPLKDLIPDRSLAPAADVKKGSEALTDSMKVYFNSDVQEWLYVKPAPNGCTKPAMTYADSVAAQGDTRWLHATPSYAVELNCGQRHQPFFMSGKKVTEEAGKTKRTTQGPILCDFYGRKASNQAWQPLGHPAVGQRMAGSVVLPVGQQPRTYFNIAPEMFGDGIAHHPQRGPDPRVVQGHGYANCRTPADPRSKRFIDLQARARERVLSGKRRPLFFKGTMEEVQDMMRQAAAGPISGRKSVH